ncbi:hypothetical protein [uncultured Draconibacterium sp.]|uniref:hypothetical protein n=1 Tax=uncultured Draconibacterium sp. TaxID=1573823 RepID=UPI0029C634EB|nr:hypothetical protein [uncultured Draconibacterium sp.]
MFENDFDRIVEKAFAIGYQTGIINLASELGLIDENISPKQAFAKYGRKQVEEWRRKHWIRGYPTGNKTRSKIYFKRSELETACRMGDFGLLFPLTSVKRQINQILGENYFGPAAGPIKKQKL